MARALEDGLRLAMPFVAALLVGAILLAITGRDPLSTYAELFNEALGGQSRIAATLTAATPLIFTGLATAIAFRAGVFNVGVEGSFYLGGLAAAWVGFAWIGLGGTLQMLAALGFGALVGGLWMLLPGWLRARLDVDEVVTTLMLNFIAIGIALWLVNGPLLAAGSANSATPMVLAEARLPRLMPPSTLNAGFLIGLAALVAYGVWLRLRVGGFENRLVGLNPRFARSVGISVSSVILLAIVLSGVIGGLGGATHALGVVGRFSEGFSPGYGFTGIAVALLGRNRPVGILIGALIFGALTSAGTTVQLFADIPLDLVQVLEGTVMMLAVVEAVRWARRRRAVRAVAP
ncbi:MAG: ABC transporter permease [Pseudomonadota bacterium]